MVADVYTAGVDEDFVAEVAAKLTPGKFAVVANISEGWDTPVDAKMEQIGGIVFRTAKQDFEAEQRAKEILRFQRCGFSRNCVTGLVVSYPRNPAALSIFTRRN